MSAITQNCPGSFHYYQTIQVRYADLDPLQHVNNVAILEYVEHARTGYYQASGIWDGTIRQGFGMVVASMKIDYLASIMYGDSLRVGIRVSALGDKSLHFPFSIESADGKIQFARGEVIMVAMDHASGTSRRIPEDWRMKIAKFENNEELAQNAQNK